MGKNKKKRNKVYTGPGAAVTKPIITKVAATDRSKLAQWYIERKTIVKTVATITAIVIGLTLIIIEIVKAIKA